MSIFDLLNPQEFDYGPTPEELQAFWQVQDRYAGGAPGATPLQSEGYGGNFGPPPPSWQDRLGTAFASAPQYPVRGFGANLLQGAVRGYGQASVQDQNRRALISERQQAAQRDQNRAALEATQRQRDRELRASMAAQTLAAHGADKRREMLAEAAKAAASTPEAQGANDARQIVARNRLLAAQGQPVPGADQPDNPLQLTTGGIDAAALRYATDGTLPPMGMGKAGIPIRSKIINRAAELFPNLDISSNAANYQSDKSSLAKLQVQSDAVKAFENTMLANINILKPLLDKIPDTGSEIGNRFLRPIVRAMGSKGMASYNTALQTVQKEAARILHSGGTLAGQLSDHATSDMQAVVSGSYTKSQMLGTLGILEQDSHNRSVSYDSKIADVKSRMKARPGMERAGAPNEVQWKIVNGQLVRQP